MVQSGLSYYNLQEKVGIEYQKVLSRKQCKKGGNYLQLLSIATLEMYRVVYLTVFSFSGHQFRTEQIGTYVCVHVCMFVYMDRCIYVYVYRRLFIVICIYIDTYVCMYVHRHVRTYICTWVCMYIGMYIDLFVHRYMYT